MEGLELQAEEAQSHHFDKKELRWVLDAESTAPTGFRKNDAGIMKLFVGKREIRLGDIVTVSSPSPDFLVLDIRDSEQVGLKFSTGADAAKQLLTRLRTAKADYERFDQYDPGSVQSYFQYYGKLANQQNMLQDHVRTGHYQRAITENLCDFQGASVMDVGAGSGILSFFAAQVHASTVFAVEASSMADVVRAIADGNSQNMPLSKIVVVNKTLENITTDDIENKVDILISEPIGTFLFNERMIETYLCARDRFLKPGGKMFPNAGDLCIAPFSDNTLHWEQQNKHTFWKNNNFYGLDLSPALSRSGKEQYRQPVVDYINPEFLVSQAQVVKFDFQTVTVESLKHIEIPFEFEINQPCLIHGLGGWFDAHFHDGTASKITLSTAPWCPGTHWYQIRFLLEVPLAVNAGQCVEGRLEMDANNLQSYFIKLRMGIKGTDIVQENNHIDLKDPEYRFYSSPNSYCPPGTQSAWNNTQQPAQQQQQTQSQQQPAAQNPQSQQLGQGFTQQQGQTQGGQYQQQQGEKRPHEQGIPNGMPNGHGAKHIKTSSSTTQPGGSSVVTTTQ